MIHHRRGSVQARRDGPMLKRRNEQNDLADRVARLCSASDSAGYSRGYQKRTDEITEFRLMKPNETVAEVWDYKEAEMVTVAVPEGDPLTGAFDAYELERAMHRGQRIVTFQRVSFAFPLQTDGMGRKRAIVWTGWVPRDESTPMELRSRFR